MAKKKEKKQEDEYAVIDIADTHIGSTNALCPPSMQLDDGGTYLASRPQRLLWDYYLDFIEKAKHITNGHKTLLVINGDIGELDSKGRSNQVITRNKTTLMKMADKVLGPITDTADKMLITRGTAAHSGKSAWMEEWFASNYSSMVIPEDENIFSHYHFAGDIGGVKFDIAHHARMGGMRHTHKTYAVRLAQDVMDKYRDRNMLPPDIVLRAHNHRRADSGDNWPTFAVMNACWQLHTEFIYRIGGENDNPQIGGNVFLCHPFKGKRGNYPFIAREKFVWYPIKYDPYVDKKKWDKVIF